MRSDLRSDLRSLPRSWPIRLALSWTTLWPICNLYNFPTIMFSGGQILSDESVNFVAKFRHMCMHKIRGNVRDICSLNFYGFNVFACCASGNACIAWLGVCMAFDRRTLTWLCSLRSRRACPHLELKNLFLRNSCVITYAEHVPIDGLLYVQIVPDTTIH